MNFQDLFEKEKRDLKSEAIGLATDWFKTNFKSYDLPLKVMRIPTSGNYIMVTTASNPDSKPKRVYVKAVDGEVKQTSVGEWNEVYDLVNASSTSAEDDASTETTSESINQHVHTITEDMDSWNEVQYNSLIDELKRNESLYDFARSANALSFKRKGVKFRLVLIPAGRVELFSYDPDDNQKKIRANVKSVKDVERAVIFVNRAGWLYPDAKLRESSLLEKDTTFSASYANDVDMKKMRRGKKQTILVKESLAFTTTGHYEEDAGKIVVHVVSNHKNDDYYNDGYHGINVIFKKGSHEVNGVTSDEKSAEEWKIYRYTIIAKARRFLKDHNLKLT